MMALVAGATQAATPRGPPSAWCFEEVEESPPGLVAEGSAGILFFVRGVRLLSALV